MFVFARLGGALPCPQISILNIIEIEITHDKNTHTHWETFAFMCVIESTVPTFTSFHLPTYVDSSSPVFNLGSY